MPVATVSTEAVRHDLKTLPAKDGEEGGFVVVRPLPYGMVLDRRDKGSKLSMESEVQPRGKGRSRNQNEPQVQKLELETLSSWMVQHDFAYCITDHNLTAANGNPLDFSNPLGVKALDPKVGAEIESILSELNEPDEDEQTVEDFTTAPTSASQVSATQ